MMQVLTCPLCGESGVTGETVEAFEDVIIRGEYGRPIGTELRVHYLSRCANCRSYRKHGDGTVIPQQAIDGLLKRSEVNGV